MPIRSPLVTSALALALLLPAGAACSQRVSVDAGGSAATIRQVADPRVVAISVDGLNTDAIDDLGRRGTPTIHRLLRQGAGTLNARTEVEKSITLPNHTGMMTSRRVYASRGGHGVTWNSDRAETDVQRAAGHPVSSIFSVVHDDGGSTALFSTKAKFGLFQRSWPHAIDRFAVRSNQQTLVRRATTDLVARRRAFTFLHVSLPDRTGHAHGGMTPRYLAAVRRTDRQLGGLVDTIARSDRLRRDTVVILTADHGFAAGKDSHSTRDRLANYRIPFVVWGAGIEHADLYEINPDYLDPGTGRPSYAPERQPVRNGAVANLAAGLLGLPALRGSGIDAEQDLDVG